MQFTRKARTTMGAVAVAALVATGAGAAPAGAAEGATEPAAEAAGCNAGMWPANVGGQPASFEAGAATGVYLWHTDAGWRLRVTHPGNDKVVFRGAVTSASTIHAVERRTESGDAVVTPGRRRVAFRFTNYGHIDGMDFRMACGPGFAVNVSVNGRTIPADQVFIGADGHHPDQAPFRVERRPASPAAA